MFTIITAQKIDKKAIRLKKMQLHYIQQNDIRFCVVRLKNKRKIDWIKLERLLGDTKTRIIVADDLRIPNHIPVKTVDCATYSHMLTQNAIEKILCYHKEYIKTKSVTLIDIGCRYQSYADILVRYFSVVRIITNKLDFYHIYKDAKFYEYGATILVSDHFFKTASDNVLFVSPEGIILPEMTNQTVPIITAKQINCEINAPVYHSFRANTPNEYLVAIPDEIFRSEKLYSQNYESDSSDFEDTPEIFLHSYQAALYEYCGLRTLSKSNPVYGYANQEKKMMDDIKIHILSIDTK